MFTSPPAAWLCPEPCVVTDEGWERVSLLDSKYERGVAAVYVLICRIDPEEAGSVAREMERKLRSANWSPVERGDWFRVIQADSEPPADPGRDSSGRWLRGFRVRITAMRTVSVS